MTFKVERVDVFGRLEYYVYSDNLAVAGPYSLPHTAEEVRAKLEGGVYTIVYTNFEGSVVEPEPSNMAPYPVVIDRGGKVIGNSRMA